MIHSSSININEKAKQVGGMKCIAKSEVGVLWRLSNGIEVIETNGDPVWENDNDFHELRKMVMNDSTITG
jgi:hypothetical protein